MSMPLFLLLLLSLPLWKRHGLCSQARGRLVPSMTEAAHDPQSHAGPREGIAVSLGLGR
jgi:hypothetical protein